MRYLMLATCGLMLVSLGCNVKQAKEQKAGATSSFGDAAVLEPLLLTTRPADAKTIAHVRDKASTGDEVIVQGTVPPDCVVPFNDSRAVVILMDPSDLASESVQNEFSCPDAATCPACRKVLDTMGVQVEIMDKSGTLPVKSTLQGFKGLKAGSTITVKGKLQKDGDKLLIRATAFFVG